MINLKKFYSTMPNLRETCIFSLLCGIIAHLFVLTNIIHNYDNIAVFPNGYGTGLRSGRWFLTILGDFVEQYWGNYNIPFFNGLISICILTASAYMIVLIFNIKSPLLSALWGGFLLYRLL